MDEAVNTRQVESIEELEAETSHSKTLCANLSMK